MIYDIHKLAEMYNVSVRTLQRKLKMFAKEYKIAIVIKNKRSALKEKDCKKFLEYCGINYDIKRHKTTQNDNKRQIDDIKRHKTTINDSGKDEIIQLLKQQLQDMKDNNKIQTEHLKAKDEQLKQQNSIIAMTQKNLNDLIQDHKKLKYDNLKKAELINKWSEDQENIKKLHKLIDKAMGDKREKDVRKSIQFGYELLKEKKKQNNSK